MNEKRKMEKVKNHNFLPAALSNAHTHSLRETEAKRKITIIADDDERK